MMRNLSVAIPVTRVVALGLMFCGVANANPTISDQAVISAAGSSREDVEAQLSQRYAALWAALPTTERASFAARERQWLNSGRWQEKDACVAERGPGSGPRCVLEVTLRHAATLAASNE